ncbi:MAG: hypothetical protein QOG77_1918 [Solirubrobacteraceae bacterium]|nr:hypothetical protein [Solirubrobacteraceae bacterium]
MHNRIDAVAGSAPGRLLPVDPIQSQRRAQDEHAGLERQPVPAVSFAAREDPGVNAYTPPADAVVARTFVTPDPVAPALAEALAAEPWGHPMPHKAVWEQAVASRERTPEPVEASVTIVASTATSPAAPASSAPAVTPVATTAAAPATPAAVATAGSAAPVSPAWLTSLLKAR